MNILAMVTVAGFVILSGLHFYWVFGGKRGFDKSIPTVGDKPTLNPGRVITTIVALGLLGFGVITYLLGFTDIKSMKYGNLIVVAGWCVSAIFLIRAVGDFKTVGFFKKIRTTDFGRYDTKFYSPLCLFLAIVLGLLAFRAG